MSARNRGQAGEDFAAAQLTKAGYSILERNWRYGRFEIDMIVRKDEVVAFVEVKLRGLHSFASPAESVRKDQRRRIAYAAAAFLQQTGLEGSVQPRFDIFEITVTGAGSLEVVDFYHMEHAYDLEGLCVFL